MRKSCCFIWFFAASAFWAGCDTFPQMVQAEPASRMGSASNRPDPRQVEMANLKADVQALDHRVREFTIALEELARENRALAAQLEQQRRQNSQLENLVRQAELARAIGDLERRTQQANSEQRRAILREVTAQIEELGKQTQAAIDALARNISSRPGATVSRATESFSDDFPKEGISYVVQRGDTLSGIASRHNSTIRDIQNANRITNPASIQVGQTLFIPQRAN